MYKTIIDILTRPLTTHDTHHAKQALLDFCNLLIPFVTQVKEYQELVPFVIIDKDYLFQTDEYSLADNGTKIRIITHGMLSQIITIAEIDFKMDISKELEKDLFELHNNLSLGRDAEVIRNTIISTLEYIKSEIDARL